MRNGEVGLLIAALLIGAASPASADAVFSNEKDFLSAAGSASFESFEELSAENAIRENTITTAGFTVTTVRKEMGIFSSVVSGLHATDGSNHLIWDARPGQITFTFEAPITAFGVSLNDALDQGADPRLSLTTSAGAAFPDFLTGPLSDANESFVGIITDAPFTRVTISHNTRESMGFDGVHYSPSARPTTALLPATDLAGLAGAPPEAPFP